MSPARYVPPIHTQRNESSPWDGCWALALGEAIDAASGGKILVTEAQIRHASANPDRPGVADGGNSEDQLDAIAKLAPKIRTKPAATGKRVYPTAIELRDHLAAGGGAALSGYQADAPIGQRQYDARFYDRNRFGTGHGIYVQGTGDGLHVYWLDPLIPAGTKPPVYLIGDALKFCWGDAAKRIAVLVWPAELVATPAPKPDRVRVTGSWWDYDISGKKPSYNIGRVSRTTRDGWSAPLEPLRIEMTWGGRDRIFAQVAAPSAYLGRWVDLTGAPNVIHLPAD